VPGAYAAVPGHVLLKRTPTLTAVVILLPPSEGKSSRRRGAAVSLGSLSFPELTQAREQVLESLAKVSEQPDAVARLGIGASLTSEVQRNTRWRTEPALPASALYSGVLYDALDLAGLPAGAKRKAASRLLVSSAAWGVLRPGDRVPPYRVGMDVDLPDVGQLAAFWRRHLGPVLDDVTRGHVVVDCRSSTYAATWRPRGETAARTVAVRVRRPSGWLSAGSHLRRRPQNGHLERDTPASRGPSDHSVWAPRR
jgi:uncharacterized protein